MASALLVLCTDQRDGRRWLSDHWNETDAYSDRLIVTPSAAPRFRDGCVSGAYDVAETDALKASPQVHAEVLEALGKQAPAETGELRFVNLNGLIVPVVGFAVGLASGGWSIVADERMHEVFGAFVHAEAMLFRPGGTRIELCAGVVGYDGAREALWFGDPIVCKVVDR